MIKDNTRNLNAELYAGELLDYWTSRKDIIPEEKYLIDKYLIDTTKKVLEAGTGGGRISFHIEEMGFKNISAFDFVPEMIKYAKSKAECKGSVINFEILDASNLKFYNNDTFDYLIYLQQVLCFIEKEDKFLDSLKEAYRIANKGGIIIFSFLDFDSRILNPILSLVMKVLRKLRNEKISKQHLPWLKIKNKFNLRLLHKNQPVTYWVKKDQIIKILMRTGFSIVESSNANQLNRIRRKGMLYIVCRK